MALKLATGLRNNRLDEITAFAGTSAILTIYSGTQPSGGGTPTTLLAQLTCNASQFAPAASGGVLTLSSVASETNAPNSGTATWFRITKSDGTTWVMDGSVSTTNAGGDLQLDDTAVVATGTVALSGPNTLTDGNAA